MSDNKPTRFSHNESCQYELSSMREDENGEYVRWNDYKSHSARIAELEKGIAAALDAGLAASFSSFRKDHSQGLLDVLDILSKLSQSEPPK